MESFEKKEIATDWLRVFPTLYTYSATRLWVIMGPLICGLDLGGVRFNASQYRPHFVAHPLWNQDLKACIKATVILQEFRSNRNLQFNISFEEHKERFAEIADCVNNQKIIPLDRSLLMDEFMEGIDKYSGLIVPLQLGDKQRCFSLQTAFYVALYTNDLVTINRVLQQIEKESALWDMKSVEYWFGPFDKWLQSLYNKRDDSAAFLELIQKNKQDKKLSKLLRFDILP